MVVDGAHGDHEAARDLAAGRPRRGQQRDLAFAGRKVGSLRRVEHRRRARPFALRQPERGPRGGLASARVSAGVAVRGGCGVRSLGGDKQRVRAGEALGDVE